MFRVPRLAIGLMLISVTPAPPAIAAPAAALVPRLAPAGGLELHRSPARAGARRVTAWNALIDDQRAYVRLDGDAGAFAEGIGYTPGKPLRAGDPRLGRLVRQRRYTFTGGAPAWRVHLSYGAERGEARAWVWTSGPEGRRLRFEGRALRRDLPSLVEWAWAREVERVLDELVAQSGDARVARAVARLPERWFR